MKIARYAAVFIAAIIYFGGFGIKCSAGVNGGGTGESSLSEGGAYDESQIALRFSLIDKDGVTLDSVDMHDPISYSSYVLQMRLSGSNDPCIHKEFSLPDSSKQYIFKGSKTDVLKYGLGDSSANGLRFETWANTSCPEKLENPIRVSGSMLYNTLDDGTLYIDYLKKMFTQDENYGKRLNAVFSLLSPLSSLPPADRFREFSKEHYTLMIEPVIYTVFNTDGRAGGSQDLLSHSDELCYLCCDSMFYGTVTELAMFIEESKHGQYNGDGIYLDRFIGPVLYLEAHALYINEPPTNDTLGIKQYSGSYNNDSLKESMGVITFDYTNYAVLASKSNSYDYRTGTNVITSVPIKNVSRIIDLKPDDAEYNAAAAANRSPIGIKAKLIVSRNDTMTDVLTDSEQAELGIPEYVSAEGLPKRDPSGAEASSYLYFKWKTPSVPQTLYISYVYMDHDNKPLDVNPYEDGVEMPERIVLDLDRNNDGIRDGNEDYCYYSCRCVISDTMGKINSDYQPPDPISGFFAKPSAADTSDHIQNYNKNIDAYNSFNISESFNMNSYVPFGAPDRVKSLSWTEYTVTRNNATHETEFAAKEYHAYSWLMEEGQTSPQSASPFCPIYLFDSTPQKDINIFGKKIRSIPSGYGFSVAFTEDYTGNGTITADSEYMKTITNSCTLFQNGVVLFPEFNYSSGKIMAIETRYDYDGDENTFDCFHVLADNPYSLFDKRPLNDISSESDIRSRVHFTPIWYPDNSEYNIEIVMFDYWTPAGQIYDHKTYRLHIDGALYDNWYATKSVKNQKK